MAEHALLSASGAHRWLACPPSAKLELIVEPEETSVYASEGTLAHAIAEASLRADLSTDEKERRKVKRELAKLRKDEQYSEEMGEYVKDYTSYVISRYLGYASEGQDVDIEIEQRLDFSEWVPGGFGTADALLISDRGVEVVDLKYGRGVEVMAQGNPQLMLYGLGAYAYASALYSIDTVTLTIIQPRIKPEPETVTIPVDELLKWAEDYVAPRARLAWEGKGELAPSPEACRFCKVRHLCVARAQEVAKLFDEVEETEEAKTSLTLDEVADLYRRATAVESWIKDARDYLMASLAKGERVNGLKLVEGRANRKISDPDGAATILKGQGYEDIYKPTELLGITALERLVGKAKLSELLGDIITRPMGKPTLADSADKRPEYVPADLVIDALDDDYQD